VTTAVRGARLLEKCASEQSLIESWEAVREKDTRSGARSDAVRVFERRAAQRILALSEAILGGTWRPDAVTAVAIPKGSGGQRELHIPSVADRIVERAVLAVVDPVIDPLLLPWSFAYRRGLGVDDALRALAEAREDGCLWVLRSDIRDCFDSIPRARVLKCLAATVDDPGFLEVVRLLVYRRVQGGTGSNGLGLHQGGALSPLLCNLYLDQFDRAMLERGLKVIRYADDFAIPAADRAGCAVAEEAVREILTRLRLSLNESKTSVHAYDEGVPFLGEVTTATTTPGLDDTSHPLATTVYVTEAGSLIRSRGGEVVPVPVELR